MALPSKNSRRDSANRTLENLESRCMMDADISLRAFPFVPWESRATPEQWAQRVTRNYYRSVDLGQSPSIETFSSESIVVDRLSQIATDYWKDLFGKELNDQLYHPWSPEAIWLNRDDGHMDERGILPVSLSFTTQANALDRTSVQIGGIDEADRYEVTADGYMFVRNNGRISIVDIRDPAKLKKVADIEANVMDGDFFLSGDLLIVVGNSYPFPMARAMFWEGDWEIPKSQTQLQVYDVQDRDNPTLRDVQLFDGYNHSARLDSGRLTLIQSWNPMFDAPKLVNPVTDQPVELNSKSLGRFETAQEYLDRVRGMLVSTVLPNMTVGSNSTDIGIWSDIAIANGQSLSSSYVVQLEIGEQLQITGSETLVGLLPSISLVTHDNVYLTRQSWNQTPNGLWERIPFTQVTTELFRISGSNSELKADDIVSIEGQISNARDLDEHEGHLRVAVAGNLWGNGASQWASLYVIGDQAEGWGVVGKLEDFADGQQLLSAYFDGDRAIVTTGVVDIFQRFIGNDPLHGIDLSDPQNPRELSDVAIPGAATHLVRIDHNHWVGLGFAPDENRLPHLQVSLYDVTDLKNPQLVSNWLSERVAAPFAAFSQWNSLAIQFDESSGILSFTSAALPGGLPFEQSAMVFKIDVNSDQPLEHILELATSEWIQRSIVIDDAFFTISDSVIQTRSLDDFAILDSLSLRPTTETIDRSITVAVGATASLPLFNVLEGDVEVGAITGSGPGELKFENGLFVYTAPNTMDDGDSATFTVTLQHDGETRTAVLRVILVAVEQRASILVRAEDDDGQVVSSVTEGAEFWVVLSVQDLRSNPTGVYAGYFNVSFDPNIATVIGDVDHLEFTNVTRGTVTEGELKSVGGVSRSQERLGAGPQDIVRFKVRIEQNGPLTFSVLPSVVSGEELLLYDVNTALPTANVVPGQLALSGQHETEPNEDMNQDGFVTSIDVLLVINYLNSKMDRQLTSGESVSTLSLQSADEIKRAAAYDVSRDGDVTALDALLIINKINFMADRAAAEGEPAKTENADYAMAVDQTIVEQWSPRKRSSL